MENTVFSRTEHESHGIRISTNVYNLVIGLVLCWGFLVNWLMVKTIPYESIAGINPWAFFIGYFASCFFGIFLFTKSEAPLVSFIGYNFVVVPFGLIINLVVYHYDPTLVVDATLVVVIIVEMIEIFVFKVHHGIIDWVIAVIFCGYIGYDWGRANRIPKTVDNAVDSAASLYMDIINLFLRILRIMGRRR
ncbi:MAG: US12 family protein [Deltaproteobacteria bacterium]|nr:US12 family protein [Deltaproteobacteria bacterium]